MTISTLKIHSKRFSYILILVAALLSIPFIVMQFTNEVSWKAGDFVMMGILLTGGLLICDFAMQKVKKSQHRLLICVAVTLLFLLIWVELAVGILGTPFAGS